MGDLIERLQSLQDTCPVFGCDECADISAAIQTIASLQAQLAEMREALAPFAAFARGAIAGDDWTGHDAWDRVCDCFEPSDFIRAAALSHKEDAA